MALPLPAAPPPPARLAADAWAQEELAQLEARGLRRTLEPLAGAQGAVVEVGGRPLLNF
jgi:8-amino-7-oxononanoate synthase